MEKEKNRLQMGFRWEFKKKIEKWRDLDENLFDIWGFWINNNYEDGEKKKQRWYYTNQIV